MKTVSKVGFCVAVFSLAVCVIYQEEALNSVTRFTTFNINDRKEESCLSRSESVLYRKPSPHKPSSYLTSKLRSYEELHVRCGPHTDSYKRSIKQLKFTDLIDASSDCQYVAWVPFAGLGNRILSITSAFLYALLTNRVLLIKHDQSMAGLFCEPFLNSSWILPYDFHLKGEIRKFKQDYHHTYGNMLKTNTINASTELFPSYLFLYLFSDYDHHDKLFFCDEYQAILSKVPWLIIKSNVYFIPSLFLMPSFEEELSKLFPDRETVFHHLGSYLFQPSNQAWRLITKYYQDHLAKAEKRVGIQIRIFDLKTSPFEYVMDQILGCIQMEKLLPQVDTEKSLSTSPSENQTRTAVLITSLFPDYFKKLKNMYEKHPTKTGEVVTVFQPSQEKRQRSSKNLHNMKAWVDMYLLSLSDELVTSAQSTFGYVAQGLAGMRPWILYKIDQTKPDPLCGRGISMEPCFHSPPSYDCKAKTTVDTTTLVPYLKRCEDIGWGIKLFNTS